MFDASVVEVVRLHGEVDFVIRWEGSVEILGVQAVLHISESLWQAIDDHHGEDVVDRHGASGSGIEDSVEGQARVGEGIRVRGEGASHGDLEEILECMLGNCKAGHSGVGSFSNGIHCEKIVVVSSKDIGLIGP